MTVVGTIELIATIDTSKYKKGAKEVDDTNDDMEKKGKKSSEGLTGSLKSVAKVGFGALIGAAVAAGAAIISNVDNAIKRVDTLKNSSRTFENLGFSADSVQKAMSALEKSIQGLPTSLDQSVRGVQLLAASTGDIAKSQKIFSAINNAIIGFGGTSDDVSGVIRQFSQALAGGKIDAETYNSFLDNGLGATLVAIGKLLGRNSKQLKEGLSDGTISIDQFNDALLKLNTEGGGGMKSLEQIAKDSTNGIGTSFDNANTAITRGISKVIEKIGAANIASVITNIGKFFENSAVVVVAAIDIIGNAINEVSAIVRPLIDYISQNTQVFEVLKIALIAVAAILTGALLFGFIGIVAILAALTFAIQSVIDFVGNLIVGFINAVNFIKSLVNGLYNFFVDFSRNLANLFINVGTAIANSFGGAFRGVINGVLRFIADRINGFIDAINGAISLINKIPGVKIGALGRLPIPALANGGIVTSPTLAMIGEGRESEAVIPLSKLDEMIKGGSGGTKVSVTVSLSGVMTSSKADERAVAVRIGKLINEALAAKGQDKIGAL